jgi:hypothetical protein
MTAQDAGPVFWCRSLLRSGQTFWITANRKAVAQMVASIPCSVVANKVVTPMSTANVGMKRWRSIAPLKTASKCNDLFFLPSLNFDCFFDRETPQGRYGQSSNLTNPAGSDKNFRKKNGV